MIQEVKQHRTLIVEAHSNLYEHKLIIINFMNKFLTGTTSEVVELKKNIKKTVISMLFTSSDQVKEINDLFGHLRRIFGLLQRCQYNLDTFHLT